MILLRRTSAALILLFCISSAVRAQDSTTKSPAPTPPKTSAASRNEFEDISFKKLPSNLWKDQKLIWTDPWRNPEKSLRWAVPLTFVSALSFGMDQKIETKIPSSTSTLNRATSVSNLGVAAFAGVAATQYFWGLQTHNDKLRETGFLSGEAAVDAFALTELAKGISQRERPTDGTGQGRFFKSPSPWGSSFPSQHATIAWSIATVLANEYPGTATKILAYSGATAVGAARIIGDKHFSSDVLLGSALGYYIGRQVYRAHSSESKMDASYGVFEKSSEEAKRDASMMASTYVPLDSWVYGAFDRLNSMGVLPQSFMGHRPWTRKQCAEMLDSVDADDYPGEISQSISYLKEEFKHEALLLDGSRNLDATLESVYSGFTGISGEPLNDSYHFGQTVYNEYGRPFREGFNNYTGFSAHAEAGPFATYVRGEFQHAPTAQPYSLATRTAIAADLPIMPGTVTPGVDSVQLLDAYLALNLKDWQLSFGKQSMWWGPAQSTDLMMSNNAAPITMLRLSNVSEMRLPFLLKYLGPFSTTTFVGQLQGYHFLRLGPTFQLTGSWDTWINPQPYIWGEHFSLHPTENLEIGVSMTTVFAGLGRPATLETFRHTFSSRGNFQSVEPGDRRTGFDLRWRVPGLRDWLTFYTGSLSEDEPNPIAYPRRSAFNPGLYFVRIPMVPKLDFRIESAYTDIPNMQGNEWAYVNTHYRGGYTYNGQIMGSWVGPEGRAINARSTYWFDPQQKLTFEYRHQRTNPGYVGGGDLNDFGAQYTFRPQKSLLVTASAKYERWRFPTIEAGDHSNAVIGVQLNWLPGKSLLRK